MILLDTNLLARINNSAHPHCAAARSAVTVLRGRGERLVIVPQNLYEFWAVATRKAGAPPAGQNGLGMTTNQASQWLRYFQRRFTLLPDREELLARWHELVATLGITGLRCYDARLVAAMQCYGMTRLLTFNGGDFNGFAVTVIDPASV
jgi:predicted nucleic acid-binding protein